MHLLVPNLPYPIPVEAAASSDPSTPAFEVRIPANDPRALALTPGMEATLVRDDGHEQLIVLGRGWTTQARGSVMRIPYRQAANAPSSPGPDR